MKTRSMIGIIVIISISIFLLYYYGGFSNNNSNDLENLKTGLQSGNYNVYTTIADIPEESYKKPDFYPSYESFKDKKDRSQTGTYGYGAYPAEVSYNVTGLKAGQYIDVYTFVHSSYDVGNYQGMRLSLSSPGGGLFEAETEPSDILLSPLSIDSPQTSNWTYRIKMTIIAKKDIPEGKYVFKLKADPPSTEKQMEYMNMTSNYTNVGMIQPGKFFDFVLNAYK